MSNQMHPGADSVLMSSDPSVVCRVLSVCAVPARCGGVQSDPETAGCRLGPPYCRRDGRKHRSRDWIQHPAGDVLLQ